MNRNITLLKLILPLNQMWFWNGIWLLFYLSITNYQGVGIIEAVVFASSFLLEIPTGAIADLLGKKRTLFIAYFFYASGNLIMGFSSELSNLIISIICLALGGALYSGTAQAMLYDSLKEEQKESKFDKIYANVQTYSLLIMSFASIIGGFLYSYSHQYPWFATSSAGFLGMVIILLLKEPKMDSEKFSLKVYLNQNSMGFRELFKTKKVIGVVLQLLVIYSFINIIINVLDGGIAVQAGLTEKQMGILFAALPLISALGAFVYSKIDNKVSNKSKLIIFISISTITSVALSQFMGLIGILVLLCYRNFFYPVIEIFSQNFVNAFVESKYRATTLSTFSMLLKLPYALFAFVIGGLIDRHSATSVGLGLSLFFLLLYFVAVVFLRTDTEVAKKIELVEDVD